MQFATYEPPTNTSSNKRKVVIILLSVVVVIVALVWVVITLLGNNGKSQGIPVYARVLPTDAKVSIDGKPVEIKETIHVAAGAHQIQATADGFEEYSVSYLVDASIEEPVMVITLLPVSDKAKDYVRNNQQQYAEQERLAGQEARQQSEPFFRESPIAKELPFSNLVYTIGYKRVNPNNADDQSITIEVDAPMGYRNSAVNKIRELGYDPAEFTINFKNYNNPFKP